MDPIPLMSKAFLAAYPEEAAPILERHSALRVARLLEAHPPEVVGRLLENVVPVMGASYLNQMDFEKAARAVERLEAEQAVRLLRHMDPKQREPLLEALPPASRDAYRRLLDYPLDCVGAHMNPFVVVLPEDLTVAAAMKRVRMLRKVSFFFPYVVDRDQKLVGILTVREMMLAGARQRLADIMRRDVVRAPVWATADDIMRLPGWRAYQSLPVVDAQGMLVGVLGQEAFKRMETGGRPERPGRPWADGLVAVSALYVHVLGAMMPLMTRSLTGFVRRVPGGGADGVR